MRPLFFYVLCCIGAGLSSCNSISFLSTTGHHPQASSASPVAQAPQTPPAPIQTQSFNPQPIHIALADLPAPFATASARKNPQVVAIPDRPVLQVPAGFQVNLFAEGLEAPRWLALTPTGDVLVTETRQNRIRLLRDRNHDGYAEEKLVFAHDRNLLNAPFGMAFGSDSFFLGNTQEVRRYSYHMGQLQLEGEGQKITDLTPDGYHQHWTRNVVIAPDGKHLYVSVGSQSNVGEEPLPRASIQVMNLDGSNRSTYAYGLRNPVGLAFHPVTHELYATVNERDGLGDDLVPDYFTHVQPGAFYGWPYAYLAPQFLDPRELQGGGSKRSDLAAKTVTPDVLFQAHSAALGLQFYTGQSFPARYHNGAFVAFRGSWNRDRGTGYKVVFVPFNPKHQPEGYYEDFLTGFLLDPAGPKTWGRPVGLLVLPDGSLLVTEEANHRIYRIQYQP